MKKNFCFLALWWVLLSVPAFVYAQTSDKSASSCYGSWYGLLKTPVQKLRLHLLMEAKGDSLSASLFSLDQGLVSMPATSYAVMPAKSAPGDSLVKKLLALSYSLSDIQIIQLSFDGVSAKIRGAFTKDTAFTQFEQGIIFSLDFGRQALEKIEKKRPQTPQTPFNYSTKDVYFPNSQAGISLAGTLSFPKTENRKDRRRKYPAILLVAGSGPNDRDETILGHKPFFVLSDMLTQAGFVVLRYDKRGVGQSEGIFSKATTYDFAEDAQAGIDYLRSLPEVNSKQIGVIGHSEGGMIAPLLTANYIVLMAGPALPGSEILLMQQYLISKSLGMEEEEFFARNKPNSFAIRYALKQDSNSIKQTFVRDSLKTALKTIHEEMDWEYQPNNIAASVEASCQVYLDPWMVEFLKFDPRTHLRKLKVPITAYYGERDLQVPPYENADAFEKIIQETANEQASVVILPLLNHLFQECESGSPSEYARIEQTLSPSFLELLIEDLKKRLR